MPNGSTSEAVVDTVRYGCSYTLRRPTFVYLGAAFSSWNTLADGSGAKYQRDEQIVVMKNMTLYAQWTTTTTGTESEHVWVDLGLPSGLKWATCNVGATKPEEYGDYYAWGETEPKTTYSWSTYKWCENKKISTSGYPLDFTKYNTSSSYGTVDNKTTLELADDAARANWGGAWRMPTNAQWKELIDNCTWTWTDDYNGTGVAGQIVTSKTNGNSIFLPAAGTRGNGGLYKAGIGGYYMSSSLCTDEPDAWCMYFDSDTVSRVKHGHRYVGRSVRPVMK